METDVHINFYLVKSRVNSKMECPVFCRITYAKKRKNFSTGIYVQEKSWNKVRKRVLGNSQTAEEANIHLGHIESSLNRIVLDLKLHHKGSIRKVVGLKKSGINFG